MAVCDKDCFNCIYDDCICDELDHADYKELAALESEIVLPKSFSQKRRAACQKAYREANKDKVAAYKKAYYEANKEKYNRYMREYMKMRRENEVQNTRA